MSPRESGTPVRPGCDRGLRREAPARHAAETSANQVKTASSGTGGSKRAGPGVPPSRHAGTPRRASQPPPRPSRRSRLQRACQARCRLDKPGRSASRSPAANGGAFAGCTEERYGLQPRPSRSVAWRRALPTSTLPSPPKGVTRAGPMPKRNVSPKLALRRAPARLTGTVSGRLIPGKAGERLTRSNYCRRNACSTRTPLAAAPSSPARPRP